MLLQEGPEFVLRDASLLISQKTAHQHRFHCLLRPADFPFLRSHRTHHVDFHNVSLIRAGKNNPTVVISRSHPSGDDPEIQSSPHIGKLIGPQDRPVNLDEVPNHLHTDGDTAPAGQIQHDHVIDITAGELVLDPLSVGCPGMLRHKPHGFLFLEGNQKLLHSGESGVPLRQAVIDQLSLGIPV